MTNLEDIARMRLISQAIVQPLDSPLGVVEHLTCVQGQDFPGSTASIALRTSTRSASAVLRAYDEGEIVRSWPMRGTLFVVAAKDLGWMLDLTGQRVMHSAKKRREALGLDDAALDIAADVAKETLIAGPATRTELLNAWSESGHDIQSGRGYHSISHLALTGLICQGPTRGKDQCFVLTDQWVKDPRKLSQEQAVTEWFTRYVISHGPVPISDFLWWTKLLLRDLTPVLPALRSKFSILTVGGKDYWVSPQTVETYHRSKRATSGTYLLPGFDELVLGYGDRSAILTKAQEAQVVPGNNGVFRPTVVRAGRAIGTWKRPAKVGSSIAVRPFGESLPTSSQTALPRLWEAFPKL